MNSRQSDNEELKAFKALKHFFHDPQISNEVASKMCKGYAELFPESKYLNKLRGKYLWHRVIRGYRYKKSKNECIGTEHIKERIANLSNKSSDKDILLVSHEMSLTGAPRALLNMAILLKREGYNPYIFAFRNGRLTEEAENAGIPVIVNLGALVSIWCLGRKGDKEILDFFDSFSTIMLNTLECITMFPIPSKENRRIMGWIHESSYSYKYINKEEFENITSEFDDIYIVGEHARNNARRVSPIADSFKNLYYGVEEIKEPIPDPTIKFADGKLHLLIAGTIEERKGHHILGKAISNLTSNEQNSIIIHCAGGVANEWVKKEMLKYARTQIILEGNMSHDSLIKLLAKCDALICPSLDDPMPIVCTEAFQLGIPVLVSDQTGTASFIKDGINGFIVKGGDANDLTRGLRQLLKHRNELPEIGNRAHSIYQDNFSQEAFRNSILEIFNSVKALK